MQRLLVFYCLWQHYFGFDASKTNFTRRLHKKSCKVEYVLGLNVEYVLGLNELTHWGRVTCICVSKLTIIGWDNRLALPNIFQWKFNQNTTIFIEENAFENVLCEIAYIMPRSQCVKDFYAKYNPHHRFGITARALLGIKVQYFSMNQISLSDIYLIW